MRRSVAGLTILAATVIVLCAGILTVDYAAARWRTPEEEKRTAALQEEARTNSSAARTLEAEQKRIAEANRARRARVNRLAIVLIAASTIFLSGAKWLLAQRPAPPPKPLPKAAAIPRLKRRTRSDGGLCVVDEIVAREGRSAEAAIPILQALQEHFRYLPDDALRRVCELTEITPAQIAGTSSFYSRFRRTPVGDHLVRVCHGTACHVAGARQITEELRRGLSIAEGADTDESGTFTVEEVACLGCCSLAPVLMVDEHTVGKLTPSSAREALQ